jgi:hypothetical protein
MASGKAHLVFRGGAWFLLAISRAQAARPALMSLLLTARLVSGANT